MRIWWKTIKRQWIPYLLAYLAKAALKLTMLTCRVEIKGLERFIEVASQKKCILMLWHNRLVIIPEILHRYGAQFTYKAFISNSRDAEPLAILTNSYAFAGVIRVAHNARHHALTQMIDHLKERPDILIMTPDGPRGPRYRVKPGIVLAAKLSGARIIPLTWAVSRFWQTSTWDKLIIPKPFSKIHFAFGEPLEISAESEKELTEETVLLEEVLTALDQKSWGCVNFSPK